MLSSITRRVIAYIAKVTLKGTRHVARAKERKRQYDEADHAAARAEAEWWQDILDREAEECRQEFHRDNELWGRGVLLYEEIMRFQDMELRELEENIEQRNANVQDGSEDEWDDVSDGTQSSISIYTWSDLSDYTLSEMQDEVQGDADDELRDELDDRRDSRLVFQLDDGVIYELHDELIDELQGGLPDDIQDESRDEFQEDVQNGVHERGMLQTIPGEPEEEFSILSIPMSPLQALAREVCIAGLGQENDYASTPLAEWTRHLELPERIVEHALSDPVLQAQMEDPLWVA